MNEIFEAPVKDHRLYMRMLNEHMSMYPKDSGITIINKYGFDTYKRWKGWLDTREIYIDDLDWMEDWVDDDTIQSMKRNFKKLTNRKAKDYIKTKLARNESDLWQAYMHFIEHDWDEWGPQVVLDITDVAGPLLMGDKECRIEGYSHMKYRMTPKNISLTLECYDDLLWDDDWDEWDYENSTVSDTYKMLIPRDFKDTFELIEWITLNTENEDGDTDEDGIPWLSADWEDTPLWAYDTLYRAYGWSFNMNPATRTPYAIRQEEDIDNIMYITKRKIPSKKLKILKNEAYAEVRELKKKIK